MSTVSGQNTHPLTAVVPAGEARDPVGHLVQDFRADREFRFVKMRDSTTASQGMAVAAYRISAAGSEDTQYNVTVRAAASIQSLGRDMVGIVVANSTVTSGQHCYVMTKGRLGKRKGLYPDTVFALVSTTGGAISGPLIMSTGSTGLRLFQVPVNSAGAMITEHGKICAAAFSTQIGGQPRGQLTRGTVRSPFVHGGGFGPIV